MNLQKFIAIAASMGALALTLPTNANAITLAPTADGQVTATGFNTGNTTIGVAQSGGLLSIRNGVMEFDLSSIADGSTINSVSLDLTITIFVSETFSNPVAIDIFANNGDGVVDLADFSGGTQVNDVNETISKGGVSGDILSFSFTDLSPITAALIGNLLTVRIETDSFAIIQFATLEHLTLDAARLNIDFTAPLSEVPVPAALPLFGTGLAAMGFIGWRRKRKAKASA